MKLWPRVWCLVFLTHGVDVLKVQKIIINVNKRVNYEKNNKQELTNVDNKRLHFSNGL